MLKKPTKDISNNNEEIRRKRVTLPKTITTIDPAPRSAVQKNCSFSSGQQVSDPSTPFLREPMEAENVSKTIPVNTVKGFMEIKLQDDGGGVATIAAVQQISGISKAF